MADFEEAMEEYQTLMAESMRKAGEANIVLMRLYLSGHIQGLPQPHAVPPPAASSVASKSKVAAVDRAVTSAAVAATGGEEAQASSGSSSQACQCVFWRGADASCPNPTVPMADSRTLVPKTPGSKEGAKKLLQLTEACRKEYLKLNKPKVKRERKPAAAKRERNAGAIKAATPLKKTKSDADAEQQQEEEEEEEENVVEQYEGDEEEEAAAAAPDNDDIDV